MLASLSAVVGTCLYGLCFWLTIGYGLHGFGVRQYDVLNVPTFCQKVSVSWQTDPRRHHFVRIHSIIFASGTLGILIAIIIYISMTEDIKISNFAIAFRVYRRASVRVNFYSITILQTVVAICVIAPALVGVIMSAVINGHSYLILGQHECYASFVSGRYGYIDQYFTEWKIKLATWIGLLT